MLLCFSFSYFGSSRNLYLGNGQSETAGLQELVEPKGIKTNILYLDGSWFFTGEYAENKSQDAKIIFRYQAKNVYFVGSSQKGVDLNILVDGKVSKSMHGGDVDSSGKVKVMEDGLYHIIGDNNYGEHTLEIIIKDPIHPYTKALISAVPVPDPKINPSLTEIKGRVPSGTSLPTGCRFHPRCKYCFDPCDSIVPKQYEVDKDYLVACHLYNPDYKEKLEEML